MHIVCVEQWPQTSKFSRFSYVTCGARSGKSKQVDVQKIHPRKALPGVINIVRPSLRTIDFLHTFGELHVLGNPNRLIAVRLEKRRHALDF